MLTDLPGASLNSWRVYETDNTQHESSSRARSLELNFIALLNKRSVLFLPLCPLPPVPKRRVVALIDLTAPKALYVLPSRQLCPDYAANSQWEADEVQSACKALIHEHNLRLLLCSAGFVQPRGLRFLTLPQPLRRFVELHLTSRYQSDSGALNGQKNLFSESRDGENLSCRVFKLWKC